MKRLAGFLLLGVAFSVTVLSNPTLATERHSAASLTAVADVPPVCTSGASSVSPAAAGLCWRAVRDAIRACGGGEEEGSCATAMALVYLSCAHVGAKLGACILSSGSVREFMACMMV